MVRSWWPVWHLTYICYRHGPQLMDPLLYIIPKAISGYQKLLAWLVHSKSYFWASGLFTRVVSIRATNWCVVYINGLERTDKSKSGFTVDLHPIEVVITTLMWQNTVLWLVTHCATNCCKRSYLPSLVEQGVATRDYNSHVNAVWWLQKCGMFVLTSEPLLPSLSKSKPLWSW